MKQVSKSSDAIEHVNRTKFTCFIVEHKIKSGKIRARSWTDSKVLKNQYFIWINTVLWLIVNTELCQKCH